MFLALWEYEVKRGCQERFDKAYGPEGECARLFQSDLHYHEMRLVRDAFRSGGYLTMDFWQSRGHMRISSHRAEYKERDKIGEEMTVKERRVGWFEMAGE